MAQKVVTIYMSDLSGAELGENHQSIQFGYQGVEYEIDLSPEEAEEFSAAMEKYVQAARRVGGRRVSSLSGTSTADRSRTRAIKAWLDEQGIDYPKRGRLPRALVDQWEAAQQS